MVKINIQSWIDVITNSSTSIYQQVNSSTIDWLYDVIDSIIDYTITDQTRPHNARELFEVTIDEESFFERYDYDVAKYYQTFPEKLLTQKAKDLILADMDNISNPYLWEEINKIGVTQDLYDYVYHKEWEGLYYNSKLIIKPLVKNEYIVNTAKLLNKINGIFSCEANYNG